MNFNKDKYYKLNKIVVRLYVMNYCKCWIDINKSYHDEKVQSKRIIQWYTKVKESMMNSSYSQVKAFVTRNEINPEKVKPYVL